MTAHPLLIRPEQPGEEPRTREIHVRFGFVPSQSIGIEPPEPIWGEHFQVRTLSSYAPSLTGTFRYAVRVRRVVGGHERRI